MPGAFRANYLDGKSAARRPASIRMAQTGLEVSLDDGGRLWWPLREIRQTQGSYSGEQIRLERGQPFPEVLVIDDPAFLTALHETAPTFGRRFHDPRKRRRRILFTIVAALISIVAGGSLYLWGIPAAAAVVATRVPVSWEEKLGNAAMEEIGRSGRGCVDADREAGIMAPCCVEMHGAVGPGMRRRDRSARHPNGMLAAVLDMHRGRALEGHQP